MQLHRSLPFTAYMMLSAACWGTFMGLCFFLPTRTQFAIGRAWARSVLCMLDKLCHLTYAQSGSLPATTSS